MCGRNQHSIVKQLSSNKNFFKKLATKLPSALPFDRRIAFVKGAPFWDPSPELRWEGSLACVFEDTGLDVQFIFYAPEATNIAVDLVILFCY